MHNWPPSSPHAVTAGWRTTPIACPALPKTLSAFPSCECSRNCRCAIIRVPLPALAAWIAGAAARWSRCGSNRPRRKELADRVRSLAQAGMLMPMLALLEDPAGRNADASGAKLATAELNRIDAELPAASPRARATAATPPSESARRSPPERAWPRSRPCSPWRCWADAQHRPDAAASLNGLAAGPRLRRGGRPGSRDRIAAGGAAAAGGACSAVRPAGRAARSGARYCCAARRLRSPR